MNESEYFKSKQFQEDFRKQVEKDTWHKDLPIVYLNEEGEIVRHYKDGTIEKVNNMKETKFKVGDKAYKPKGYKFPCTIVSVFETVAGNVRVVAEMDEYGLLHIFNEDQLERIPTLKETFEKTRTEKLELLNSEGPILILHRDKEYTHEHRRRIWITDQFGKPVLLHQHQTLQFINGEIPIIDSRGKAWWYLEQSEGMRPNTTEKILDFLNG